MTHIKLTEFDQKKVAVLSCLEAILRIAEELEIKKVVNQIKETIDQLHKEQFMLSVVGEFSRGKSTFINALLGAPVLPTRTKPTTAFINKIQYRSEPGYSIVYRDKRRKSDQLSEDQFIKLYAPTEPDEDDLEEVQEYQEEMKRFDDIKWAEIYYPNAFCKEGIEIYDTPGVNDPNPIREEITFTFIPKSDAVILVLSATTPLAQSEIDFLKHRIYGSDISKVFFVVNFKDRLNSEEDERRMIEYISKNLKDVETNPRVYLVSSKDALTIRRQGLGEQKKVRQKFTQIEDTGFPALEAGLAHFFQHEKAATKLSKPIKRGIKYSQDIIRNSLLLRVGTLNVEINEIQLKIDELRPKVRNFVNEGNRIANQLRNDLIREMGPLKDFVKSYLEKMKQATVNELGNYSGELDESTIKNVISSTTRPLQTKMQQELNDRKIQAIQAHVAEAYKKLNKQGEFLDYAVKEAFQIDIELDDLDLSIYDDNSLLGGIIVGSIGLGIGALLAAPLLLPIGFLGALLFGSSINEAYKNSKRNQELRQIKAKVQNGFDHNRKDALQKFEKEWLALVNEIVLDFQNEFHEKAILLEEELTMMIREKQQERWNVEEKRKYYEGLIASLQEKSKELHNMLQGFQKQKAGLY
jgi:ribosome biogenesis GTPase A